MRRHARSAVLKHHCRCLGCGGRRCLKKHPVDYRNRRKCPRCKQRNHYGDAVCATEGCGRCLSKAPKCRRCGTRKWRRDEYRHAVELPQIRSGTGRYVVCHADCHPHEHRRASNGCKFDLSGEYRVYEDETPHH